MPLATRHRRLAAWIALVAMLALAVVPTVSRAWAFANGHALWAPVCTPQGVKLVAAADADDAPAAAGQLLEHCAFCALAGDGAVPLPAAQAEPPLLARRAEMPARFLQAACTPHAWRSAQPRGPPRSDARD